MEQYQRKPRQSWEMYKRKKIIRRNTNRSFWMVLIGILAVLVIISFFLVKNFLLSQKFIIFA